MFELGVPAVDFAQWIDPGVVAQSVDPASIKNPIKRAGLLVLMVAILIGDAIWSLIFE